MKTLASKITPTKSISLDYAPDWWQTEQIKRGRNVVSTHYLGVYRREGSGKSGGTYWGISLIVWKLQITTVFRKK